MLKNRLNKYVIAISLVVFFSSCEGTEMSETAYVHFAEKRMETLLDQFNVLLENCKEADGLPKSIDEQGKQTWCSPKWDWVSGFFPGICWNIYDYTKHEDYKDEAIYFQNMLLDQRFYEKSHDLGFVFNNSFGKGFSITRDSAMKRVLIDAGNTLAERYNKNVGCLQSWTVNNETDNGWMSKRGWDFPVIVDNLVNLELMFKLTQLTGDSIYWNKAVSHADVTMKNHYREDYSSYHVVDYNSETGEIRSKQTAQGYAHESAWARGQAWGLYGYTMCYRYTKDVKYLRHAEAIAGYILDNLPEDGIPCWDFKAPATLRIQKDASAGAIIASALIELNDYSDADYLKTAYTILKELSSSNYHNYNGKNHGFILDHSVGSIPHNAEIDVPLIYADYYYIEALMRLTKKSQG